MLIDLSEHKRRYHLVRRAAKFFEMANSPAPNTFRVVQTYPVCFPKTEFKTFWDSEKNSRACKRGIRSLRTVQTYYSGRCTCTVFAPDVQQTIKVVVRVSERAVPLRTSWVTAHNEPSLLLCSQSTHG